jgi:hypothetical protein
LGTSKSYEGPKDRTPLLPPWAFPDTADEPQPVPQLPDEPLQEQPTSEQPSTEPLLEPVDVPISPTELFPPTSSSSWRLAKISLGKSITGGGGRESFAKSGRKYVSALASTARLGQFLSSVSSRGLNTTLESFGLASVIGKDVETVFAAISNALAPAGSLREEAIARDAVNEALEGLYEQTILANSDLTKLEQMGNQDIAKALERAVSSYIYHRWLGELEIVIEKKAMSAREATRLERDMKTYIQECVQLDMKGVDVLNMDWQGTVGHQFIEKIFTEAYRILEEEQ